MKITYCNCCGKEIPKKEGIYREDFLVVEKEWGYFSKKDGEVHHFNICETCYDQWVCGFVRPVDSKERTELL